MTSQEDQPTTEDLVAAFDLRELAPTSLTAWSRVFRAVTADGRPVVVKRTATHRGNALAMARWTRAAAAAGFPVVVPCDLGPENPQLVGGAWWVLYPWVAGTAYTGSLAEVHQAGDLLGRQHALPVDATDLRPYRWSEVDEAEIATALDALAGKVDDLTVLRELAARWTAVALPTLRAATLPAVGVSSDYKANNLVFTASGPVLVDPDNGGLEPRLFDLALAVLLFHHESPGAPGRLFDAREWAVFRDAYTAHVRLGDEERALWPDALDHLLWEEGSWALDDNDAVQWADPRQGAFLRDLATTTSDRFPLG